MYSGQHTKNNNGAQADSLAECLFESIQARLESLS
jgi:hypothetical protein